MSAEQYKILFSGDADADYQNLQELLDSVAEGLAMPELDVDEGALRRVISGMLSPPWNFGVDAASPFKKVGALVTNFCIEKPINTNLSEELFPNGLSQFQNPIFAHSIAVRLLHGATIQCPYRGPVVLKERIRLSKHFWQELVSGLVAVRPTEHFATVSLLYESMAYQANPSASYLNTVAKIDESLAV